MISSIKWFSIFVIVLAGAATAWLVFQNRTSDKVQMAFWPAVAIATVGVLASIIFGLKDEVREEEFPAVFTYEKATLISLGIARKIDYRPISEWWATYHLQEIAKDYPEVFEEDKKHTGMNLYGDIVVRSVFDSIHDMHGWDVKRRRSSFSFGVGGGGYDADSPPPLKKLWKELSAEFPHSYAMRNSPSHFDTDVSFPPETEISGKEERNSSGGFQKTTIYMKNDFVDVQIEVALRGGSIHTGIYRLLPAMPSEDVDIWTANYHVTMKAKWPGYKTGHPLMPKYKSWVDNVFESVRDRLDSIRHLEQKSRETNEALPGYVGAKIDNLQSNFESNFGARIERMENSMRELHRKNDEILRSLSKIETKTSRD